MDFSLLDEKLDSAVEQQEKIPVIEILDDGTEIDPRFQFLSYSSLSTFHECPRKFQLQKLCANRSEDKNTNTTFAFGHAVGAGTAEFLHSRSLELAIWKTFLAWDAPFDAINEKQQKSLAYAILAIEIFESSINGDDLRDLKVVEYHGKPALELSFKITFPGTLTEYSFRGFLDALLQNELSEEVFVFEGKTSSGNYINHYAYKNSAQALGYSVIVDVIEPQASSYEVLYNIYMTKLKRYETFPFIKSKVQKARWLKSILHDIAQIEYYVREEGNYGHWPMRGESCTNWGRVCEYMDICTLDTKNLMAPLTEQSCIDAVDAQFVFNVEDILNG